MPLAWGLRSSGLTSRWTLGSWGVEDVIGLDGTGVNGIKLDDMEVEGVGIDVRVGLTA